jgi:polyketide synthase 12/myxalamid-type polyketide synthase MxaF
VDPQEYYAFLREMGMEYGPAFQNIRQLWHGDGQALAHVQLPENLNPAGYIIHPALLDACVQTLGVTLPNMLEVFLPLAFEHIALFADPGSELWSYVRLFPGENSESYNSEITLYGADQQVIGQISGLRLKRASRVALQRLVSQSIENWDAAAIPAHMHALRVLADTAPAFDLLLAPDVDRIPTLISEALDATGP